MEEFEIFQKVIQCFDEKEDIRDETLFYIVDILSERFVESRDDSEWQCYDNMLDYLNKVWQYKQFSEISAEQSYLYGAIWGGLRMLSSIKEKKTVSQKCHTLAEKYKPKSSYIFLHSILNRPGIQNKKLAELCEVTAARISQIATDALGDGLISVQAFGKEKSYYIRTMGKSVHDIIQKNSMPVKNVLGTLDCKVITFSNEVKVSPMPYQYKNEAIEAVEYYNFFKLLNMLNALKKERTNTLCIQEKESLPINFRNSWKLQREAGTINQLLSMK